ncbi:MAG: hypothetical protein HC904_10755 [Blastochloris sp.]|nr:hypothetical protein [Blastochloris sp.]
MISEIELAYRCSEVPVVAITGTNGKSTTTELVSRVLNAGGLATVACGNIGKPYSDVVREAREYPLITLEVSSFQLEAIQDFRPRVAVYLNFSPDHLDRYPDLESYKKAKDRIFENQIEEDHAVVNVDLDFPKLRAKRTSISGVNPAADYHYIKAGWWLRARKF